MSTTYLQLAPQQGGQRFGPFQGTVQIGSHASQCQIVLQGVAPLHATLTATGAGYTLQPADRGAELYLIRKGTAQLVAVQSAVQANAGDSIVVGSQQGACFTIQREDAPARASASQAGPSRARSAASGIAGGVAREMKRQWMARLVARNPVVRDLYNMRYRFRSGALTNPRYLIAAVGTVFGLLGMAFAACTGTLLAAWQMLAG